MTERVAGEGARLVKKLGDSSLMSDADVARQSDPVDDLKMSVFEFFKDTIKKISIMEERLNRAEALVDSRLANDDKIPLPLDDVLMIRAARADDLRRARESIISLFRPVPGAPSLLVNNVGAPTGGDGDINAMYNRLTPEDRAVFERFSALVRKNEQESGS